MPVRLFDLAEEVDDVPTSSQFRIDDARADPRTSIYLAAVLYCDGLSSGVKIRNISATGALLEGDALPSVDALVQLIRGRLITHALVAWTDSGRCGLKFSGMIDVQSWRATNAEQQRVDEVVRLVKAGAVPLPLAPLTSATARHQVPDQGSQLAADLRRVADLLEDLGGDLVGDPQVIEQHGAKLQHLDIAVQVIAAVEAIVAGHRDPQADAAKLAALRRSADQALQRRV